MWQPVKDCENADCHRAHRLTMSARPAPGAPRDLSISPDRESIRSPARSGPAIRRFRTSRPRAPAGAIPAAKSLAKRHDGVRMIFPRGENLLEQAAAAVSLLA